MAIASPCCNLSNSNSKSCGLNSLTTTGFFTMCRHHALAQKGRESARVGYHSVKEQTSLERWADLFNLPKWTAFIELTLFSNERWA